uniref:Uncharacterized protein n=1 Tax=Arundo donax TaxID=35708 RepID=A0A0A9DMT0_ARUDO
MMTSLISGQVLEASPHFACLNFHFCCPMWIKFRFYMMSHEDAVQYIYIWCVLLMYCRDLV